MVLHSCCYCCNLRVGCIISGLWLVLYYAALSFSMYYEYTHSIEETEGFLVMGICYAILFLLAFLLILAGLVQSIVLLFIFLLAQIPPLLVNLFYLLVAFIYDIAIEVFIIYALPLTVFFYIDLAACSYIRQLRAIHKAKREHDWDDEEY